MSKKTLHQQIIKTNKETRDHGDRLPLGGKADYTDAFLDARINWLQERTSLTSADAIRNIREPLEGFKGNIENLIGVATVPLGVIGPLKVLGSYANGEYYIPLATTEGVLVSSFHRGARIISKAGGATVEITRRSMHVSPGFKMNDAEHTKLTLAWIRSNFSLIKSEAEKTTKHGKLLEVVPKSVGNYLFLKMVYDTKDAMGMNMITIASDRAAKVIARECRITTFYPRSNYSSDKKSSMHNYIEGYGRSVRAEVKISSDLIRYFGTDPHQINQFYQLQFAAGVAAGMHGINGQFANGIAALFIATGQDAAQVVNSAVGTTSCSITESGDLYLGVDLPCVLAGTVGGGTKRAYAKTCLEIMDCYGSGKADKFCEILAALVLAGELSILGAMASHTFVKAHEMYGR